ELRRRWRHLPITIYAKELDIRKTTSFIAAGQFEPSGICEEYETQDEQKVLAEYLRRSRNRIIEMQSSSPHNHYGIALRRDYTLDHRNPATMTARPSTWCRSTGPAGFPSAGSTWRVANTGPG